MRQWHVDPSLLCDQHLLGEHVEHHMFAGCLLKGKTLTGYIDGGLVEIQTLIARHDELVAEMQRRGFNHKSPMPGIDKLLFAAGYVDVDANIKELAKRCKHCRARQRTKK